MPTPNQLLASLTALANGWRPLAILFHVAFAVILFMLLRGWRPLVPPRDHHRQGLPPAISGAVIRLVHFVMERRQLLGIARRVEAQGITEGPGRHLQLVRRRA